METKKLDLSELSSMGAKDSLHVLTWTSHYMMAVPMESA